MTREHVCRYAQYQDPGIPESRCDGPASFVATDPYDVVSGSPILAPTYLCLNHYNERVLAAMAYIVHHKPDRIYL